MVHFDKTLTLHLSILWGGGGTVGQQAQIKDFHTQKKVFTEQIIYLSILGLKIPPMTKKPAILTYLIYIFFNVSYEKIWGV